MVRLIGTPGSGARRQPRGPASSSGLGQVVRRSAFGQGRPIGQALDSHGRLVPYPTSTHCEVVTRVRHHAPLAQTPAESGAPAGPELTVPRWSPLVTGRAGSGRLKPSRFTTGGLGPGRLKHGEFESGKAGSCRGEGVEAGARQDETVARLGAGPGSGGELQLLNGTSRGVRSGLRLTRRGRLVLTLGMLTLVVCALLGGAARLMPSASASQLPSAVKVPSATSQVAQQVTVLPGQTLWQIARQLRPDSDPRDVMVAVRELNHLPDSRVYAGQQIVLPPL